jgi:hypothetical protein
VKALLRLCEGSIKAASGGIRAKALLRLYSGSIKALLKLYQGSIQALLRLFTDLAEEELTVEVGRLVLETTRFRRQL